MLEIVSSLERGSFLCDFFFYPTSKLHVRCYEPTIKGELFSYFYHYNFVTLVGCLHICEKTNKIASSMQPLRTVVAQYVINFIPPCKFSI